MFAKIFLQIYDSSIAEDYNSRRMFMDMLVLSDCDGCVDMTHEAISRRINVPLEHVIRDIDILCKPDPKSRSKTADGRRLVPIDNNRNWGWRIVNYQIYREMRDEEARKTYMRNYMRDRRVGRVNNLLTPVNTRKQPLAQLANTEADTEEEEKRKLIKEKSPMAELLINFPIGFKVEWDQFLIHRKKKRAPMTAHAQKLLLTVLARRPTDAIAALQMAMTCGWTGFKWEWFDHDRPNNTRNAI